ncbi:sugar transferase [Marinitoga sp. 1138]|uniref:sugar transferase n=1 Tax=Marinitoga sp. 1138 TaxID=1643334 RepID=UPI0020CA4F6A|nr:sugar transferase [Marinitoga sp. 1138]
MKYLVIGKKEDFKKILDEITLKTNNKMQFGGYLNPNPTSFKENLKYFDRILIADPSLEHYIKKELEDAQKNGYIIEILPEIAEKYLQRIPLIVLKKFKYYYSEFFIEKSENRFLDIIITLLFLIIASPLLIVIYTINYFMLGKPVIFKQTRVGKNEKKFLMYKFRTIHNNHINKFCKFLRKTRLDELPQFFNVLKGNMNFIGPRPEMISFHDMCMENIEFYNYRLLVNPGITGWAQVKFKYTTNLEDYKIKTEYDLYYVKNKSLLLDIKILLLTFLAIFKDQGSL